MTAKPSDAEIREGVGVVLRLLRRAGLGEEARDLAQEVVSTAVNNIGKMPAGARWLPWLVGIAKKKLAEYKRGETRRANRVEAVARCVVTEARTPQLEARHEIQRIFAELTEYEQDALVCSYVLGMSGPEAAAHLGVTTETFAKRLAAARVRIRNLLEKDPRDATG